MSKNGEQLYAEKEARINDAIQLKEPDRVPLFPTFHLFAAKYAGITKEEAFKDSDKWFGANKKMILDFDPDIYFNPDFAVFSSAEAFNTVDFKQVLLPGYGVPSDASFQFVEDEYMKEDEYDAFLEDPSDYALRTYMPRIFGTLEPLKMLPPLTAMLNGYAGINIISVLAAPPLANAFESLSKAAQESAKWGQAGEQFHTEMAGLGYPPFARAVALAPFDVISDMMRGMKGSMLDMYRQPDKLIKTQEKLFPMILGSAIGRAQMLNASRVFMPLHRGADGFMSNQQFEKFYWPFLKELIQELINAGLTPCPFFEGTYQSRLSYLKELPAGKIMGIFDRTDMVKAKKELGDNMCIAGNVPAGLMDTGKPEDVKNYCKKLIDDVGSGGGFVMSPGGVLDEARPENVKAMCEATREYGVY
ncbi:MAG: uroporphyrinogen decarboxylase family protein [Bacillota bacterium]